MKKILSMAAIALIMAGCANDEEKIVIDNGEVANALPIQISQKVAGVETKGAITSGSKMQAVILMVDGASNSASEPNFSSFTPKTENTLTSESKFSNDAARANVANAEFTAQTAAQAITLTPTLYYPVENENSPNNTWILGVAPQGVVSGNKVTFSQTDGLQDVMFADKQAAGTSKSVTPSIALDFNHKTTQLTFVAKLTGVLTGTEWAGKAVSVKNITILGAKVPASLTFSTGAVTWTEGTNLVVAGCNTELTTTACSPSVPVMVAPAAQLVVGLELSVGGAPVIYNNLVVKNSSNDLATIVGKSHEITFEITAPKAATGATQITTSAKVVDWTVGDPGKVEIK